MIVLSAKQKNDEDDATYSMEMVAVNSKDNLYTMRLLSTRADEAWKEIKQRRSKNNEEDTDIVQT